MVLCLSIALLIGLVMGWLLSKTVQSKKYLLEIDTLTNKLNDKNDRVKLLEKQFSEKEKDSLGSNLNLKEVNQELHLKITQLNNDLHAKSKELEEFETVLLKAEETIAKTLVTSEKIESANKAEEELKSHIKKLTLKNNEKNKVITLYQERVSKLENELKLYTKNKEEDEFIVSKDQFTYIEKQLADYQKEIKKLKEDNSRLAQLSNRK